MTHGILCVPVHDHKVPHVDSGAGWTHVVNVGVLQESLEKGKEFLTSCLIKVKLICLCNIDLPHKCGLNRLFDPFWMFSYEFPEQKFAYKFVRPMLKCCHLLLYAELASLVLEHLHVVLRHGVLSGALI